MDGPALAATESGIWGIALQLPHDSFFLSIVGPGQLLLRCGSRVLAGVIGNELFEYPELKSEVLVRFPQLGGQPKLIDALVAASVMVRQIGHGGTVIVVDGLGEGLSPNRCVAADSRYRTWADETAAEAELKQAPDNEGLQARSTLEGEHRKVAESALFRDLMQLTATDGALVLDKELNVVCFGAKIECSDSPPEVEVFTFGITAPHLEPVEAQGGTRHQSAARLVWNRADAVVLIVSQDGRCSLWARVDRPEGPIVRVLRGFERAVPLDAVRFGSFGSLSA